MRTMLTKQIYHQAFSIKYVLLLCHIEKDILNPDTPGEYYNHVFYVTTYLKPVNIILSR